MNRRDELLPRVRALFDGRLVRWAGAPQPIGDYDGRDRTLEVFNADARVQLELLRRLRPLRSELEAAAGGAVVVIFHTTAESARLYGDFIAGDRSPLEALAARLRTSFPEAQVELADALTVRLGDRRVVIEHADPDGFDIWLAIAPVKSRDSDLCINDVEHALRSVGLLLLEPDEITLDEELEHVTSGRESGDADTNLLDPSQLDVEDRSVDKGSSTGPRRAA